MVRVEVHCRDCGHHAETEVGAGGDVIGTAAALGHFQAEQQQRHPEHAQGFQVTWVWEESWQAMEFVEAILGASFRA